MIRMRSLPAVAGVAALAWMALHHPAVAQAHNPFSVGISEGGGSASGLSGWLLAKQSTFEQMLSEAVCAAKADGSALWMLSGLSFAYGVVHAAGPGHGKAVVASYMFANERALRRGVIISFLAAGLQGLVAIALIGVLALIFHATAQRMKDAAQVVESLSYAGIVALGLWLVWRKGQALLRIWRAQTVARLQTDGPLSGAANTETIGNTDYCDPVHVHCSCAKPLLVPSKQASRRAAPSRSVMAHHEHDDECGHVHAPNPATLGDEFSWMSALMTVVAAGLRPCSGAILVLVFALAQGIFVAGIVATLAMSLGTAITTSVLASLAVFAGGLAVSLSNKTSTRGELVLRGIEVFAGLVILLLGTGLLLNATTSGA